MVPEPLTFDEPLVKYEFIRMPDLTGFGDYTKSGQVIPVKFNGQEGGYTHAMFLNDGPPIYGGRELWGFPKKYAQPSLRSTKTRWSGRSTTARCASPPAPWASSTGTRSRDGARRPQQTELSAQDHSACRRQPRILELVDYRLEDIVMKGAWTGPAALELEPHALAPIADLPVREVVSATHIVADLTLGLGKVVYDYLER